MIHFNRPYMTGAETEYIRQAVAGGKISGNGEFTHRCQEFFERRYGFGKCLLTTSCTDALEMAAILSGVGPGDEVIVPSSSRARSRSCARARRSSSPTAAPTSPT